MPMAAATTIATELGVGDGEDCESQLTSQTSLHNECNTNLMELTRQYQLCQQQEGNRTNNIPNCEDKLFQEREYSSQCLDQLKAEQDKHDNCQSRHQQEVDLKKQWEDKFNRQSDQKRQALHDLDICKQKLQFHSNSSDACQDHLLDLETTAKHCEDDLKFTEEQYNKEAEDLAICVDGLTQCTTNQEQWKERLNRAERVKTDCHSSLTQEQQDHANCKELHGNALNETQEWQEKYDWQVQEQLETQQQLDDCVTDLTQVRDECGKDLLELEFNRELCENALLETIENYTLAVQVLQEEQQKCHEDLRVEQELYDHTLTETTENHTWTLLAMEEDQQKCQQDLEDLRVEQELCENVLSATTENHTMAVQLLEEDQQICQQDLQDLRVEQELCEQALTATTENYTAAIQAMEEDQQKCQDDLRIEHEEHAQKIKLLEETQPAHEACQADLKEVKDHHSSCQDDLVAAEDVSAKCHDELAQAHAGTATCHGKLATTEGELTHCHDQVRTLQQTLADTRAQHFTSRKEEKENLEAEYERVKEELRQVQHELQAANHQAKMATESLEQFKANMEVQHQDRLEEKRKWAEERSQRDADLHQLKVEHASNLTAALNRAEAAEKQLQECQYTISETDAKHMQDQEELKGSLQQQVEDCQERMSKTLSESAADKEELQGSLQQEQARANAAEATVADLEQKLAASKTSNEEAAKECEDELKRKGVEGEKLFMDMEQQLEACTTKATETYDMLTAGMIQVRTALKHAQTEIQTCKNETANCQAGLVDQQEQTSEALEKFKACKLLMNSEPAPVQDAAPAKEPAPAGGTFCNLVMFKSVKLPTKAIIHDTYEGKLEPIEGDPNPKSFWYYLRPCELDLGSCSTSQCVSIESYNFPGYFLRHQSHNVVLEQWEDNNLFREDVSFCMKDAFTGGDKEVSFESVNFVNLYISSDNEVDLKILHVSDDYASKGLASFTVEYLPCDSRRHLRRVESGGPTLIPWSY